MNWGSIIAVVWRNRGWDLPDEIVRPPLWFSLRLLSRIILWWLIRLWSAFLHARGGYVSDIPTCILVQNLGDTPALSPSKLLV